MLHAYENMSLLDAFQLVATRRRIWPNDGFCRHLLRLEKDKRKPKENEESPVIENAIQQCTINEEKINHDILSTDP